MQVFIPLNLREIGRAISRKFSSIGNPGLNFAPWPLVTKEVLPVTREQNEQIGVGGRGSDAGLMLTGDENIVDIDSKLFGILGIPLSISSI